MKTKSNLSQLAKAVHTIRSEATLTEQAGARHTAKERNALSRMVEIAIELGAAHPERPLSPDDKEDLLKRVNDAWKAKAGASHSRRDLALIQEMHDLAGQMGAECTRVTRGPYSTKNTVIRGQLDAPNYLPADSPEACENCGHFDEIRGNEYCGLYDFITANNYVCDSWNHGKPDLIPGYEGKALVAKNWESSTVDQRHGRDAINNAIKSGKLVRASTKMCRRCGKRQAEEYHHVNGYSSKARKLKVIPVCSKCHSVIDPNRKKSAVDNVPDDLAVLMGQIMILRGAGSSGNWAHSGRKGKRGGSGRGGGFKRIKVKPGSSRKKIKAAAKKTQKKAAKSGKDSGSKAKTTKKPEAKAKKIVAKPKATKKPTTASPTKPAAKKVAAKKVAAKKPEAKKPEAKKPEAKKPAAVTTGSAKLDAVFDKAPKSSQADFNKHLMDKMTTGEISLQDAQKLNGHFGDATGIKKPPPKAKKKPAKAPSKKTPKKEKLPKADKAPAGDVKDAKTTTHTAMSKKHDAWHKNMSEAESDALLTYTSAEFKNINGGLRGNEKLTASNKKAIKNIDKALAKSSLDQDTVVFRGVPEDVMKSILGPDMKKWVGKEYTDKGYSSTSVNPNGAFSGMQMEIRVPKGAKAGYLGNHPDNIFGKAEQELLLEKGQKFRVLKVRGGRHPKAVLEVVP